jgi:methyltransferase-like protein/cyclopropane fatty-acyl-phospholipid synthase-like methyltransferase
MSNSVAPATSYDEVPYPGGSYPLSHPDRLAAIAKLFRLVPPNVETAHVLEIGCSVGNNLIPMAELLPAAEFLGIDLSQREIAEAQKTAAAIGLKNLELRRADLGEFQDPRKFDFIIAHGVYSWISPERQASLLRLVKEHLSPHGVAYISYNTLPGWRMRGMIRDMMLRHTRRFATPASKIQQARALLAFLVEATENQTDPYVQFLKSELENLRQYSDYYLFHDHLEVENNPIYFQDFVGQATAAGLRYLADSNVCIMSASNLHPAAQRFFAAAPSAIDAEQYADFLCNRMFRMSLLVHDSQQPVYQFANRCIREFYVLSRLRSSAPIANLLSADSAEFSSPMGTLSTKSPIAKTVLQILAEAYPVPLPFDELLSRACGRMGRTVPTESEGLGSIIDDLGATLFKGYTAMPSGCMELFTRSLPVAAEPGERPCTNGLSRHRAAAGERAAVNAFHQGLGLDPFQCELLPLLTGQHDRRALLEMLEDKAKQHRLEVRENDVLVVDPQRLRQLLSTQLESSLENLTKNALLLNS